MLDVDAHRDVLDRGIPDHRLASAVNRHASGHAAAVNHASVEEVVAAVDGDTVEGILAAQPDHGLFGMAPRVHGLDDGIVREQQGHALARVGRGEQGFADEIHAVGKEQCAVGMLVDDLLQGIAHVGLSVGFHIVGHDHVTRRMRGDLLFTTCGQAQGRH